MKRIMHRVMTDPFQVIEDFDFQPDEFWSAVSYITALGQANEAGLLVLRLDIETFLDLRMDEAERKAGIEGGTPRTIYVAGARCPRVRHGLTMAASRARFCSWMGKCAT
jgi:catechol 1,2-dioxygenase